uniref:RING-type domain-containing protein n=1 Tax=Macrostomum lignano TaxID=282301 RepID=A0A1I8FLI6_9PLAT
KSNGRKQSSCKMGYKIGGIDKLEARYKCAHCHLLLREPMQGDCGHRYCRRNCVQLKFNEAKQKGEPEINKSLKVQCPELSLRHGDAGVRSWNDHLKSARFSAEPLRAVSAENWLLCRFWAEHKEQKCPQKTVWPCDCVQGASKPLSPLDEHKSSTVHWQYSECEFCLARVKDNEEAKRLSLVERMSGRVAHHTVSFRAAGPCQNGGSPQQQLIHQSRSLVPVSRGAAAARQRRELQGAGLRADWEKAAGLGVQDEVHGAAHRLGEDSEGPPRQHRAGRQGEGAASGDQERQFDNCYDKIRQYELRMQKDWEKKLDIERKTPGAEMKILDLERRVEVLEHAGYDGVLVWKITDRAPAQGGGAGGQSVSRSHSPPFYTGKAGYKMCGRLYLNGDGAGKKHAHAALLRDHARCLDGTPAALDQNFDEHRDRRLQAAPDTSVGLRSKRAQPRTMNRIGLGPLPFMFRIGRLRGTAVARGYVKGRRHVHQGFIVDKKRGDLPTLKSSRACPKATTD